jgi:hypothetical protein
MITVVVIGKNRTLMTIECIKNIMQHLKGAEFNIIVGSDRSEPGHVQAVNYYLSTLNV